MLWNDHKLLLQMIVLSFLVFPFSDSVSHFPTWRPCWRALRVSWEHSQLRRRVCSQPRWEPLTTAPNDAASVCVFTLQFTAELRETSYHQNTSWTTSSCGLSPTVLIWWKKWRKMCNFIPDFILFSSQSTRSLLSSLGEQWHLFEVPLFWKRGHCLAEWVSAVTD